MSNELLWFAMLIVNFAFILIAYRIFGRLGLFVWIPISTIIANIQVIKLVGLFGFEATLGNIVYATSFLVTDILSENHGKKDAQRAVLIGFFSLFALTILTNLALWFKPTPNDWAHQHLQQIFGFMPRIALGSLCAYLVAQFNDVFIYNFLKKKLPATKWVWLRNNGSTMISQFLDTFIFTAIAFWGTFEFPVLVEIFWTTYLLKWVVAALDTPCIYWAKNMFNNNKIPKNYEC